MLSHQQRPNPRLIDQNVSRRNPHPKILIDPAQLFLTD
jgi:hypothetical protein